MGSGCMATERIFEKNELLKDFKSFRIILEKKRKACTPTGPG